MTRVSRNRATKELIQAGRLVIAMLEHKLQQEDLTDKEKLEIEADIKLLTASINTLSPSSIG